MPSSFRAALALASGVAAILAAFAAPVTVQAAPDLTAYMSYPFETDLVAAPHGGAIAWVQMRRGVRNVFVARAPDWAPRQVTRNTSDT